jgi:DNA-binding winged helix-turn-helix (wHTH) protein
LLRFFAIFAVKAVKILNRKVRLEGPQRKLEVSASFEKVLRMEHHHPYRLGPYVVDPARRLLLRHDEPIHLHRKAFETLLVLVRNSGRVVEKNELLKEVWADRVVEENNLSQSISTLRKALGDTSPPYQYIVTVAGVGYRLAVPVTEIAEDTNDAGSRVESSTVHSTRTRRSYVVWGVMAAILFGVFAVGGFRREWRVAAAVFRPDKRAIKTRPSLAILGFQNLSGRDEDDWISTALAQMLGTELAAGEHLRVISQEDVVQARTELAFHDTGSLAKTTVLRVRRTLGSDLLVRHWPRSPKSERNLNCSIWSRRRVCGCDRS